MFASAAPFMPRQSDFALEVILEGIRPKHLYAAWKKQHLSPLSMRSHSVGPFRFTDAFIRWPLLVLSSVVPTGWRILSHAPSVVLLRGNLLPKARHPFLSFCCSWQGKGASTQVWPDGSDPQPPRPVDWRIRNTWASECVCLHVLPSPRKNPRRTGRGRGGEKTQFSKAPAERLATAIFRPPARRLATATSDCFRRSSVRRCEGPLATNRMEMGPGTRSDARG